MEQQGSKPPDHKGENKVNRDVILSDILAIKVEAGKSLRQVQVSENTYQSAKRFVLTAPNVSDNAKLVRFKILSNLPSGRSIYGLLAADAGSTGLAEADTKIAEWREAGKSLLRYALNLLLAPKRPEFQRLKLSSSYYVYQVSKKLKGADEILQAMGYEKVGGSAEIQELKYNGDVSSGRVAETAADLVILDGELERIKTLVQLLRKDQVQFVLAHILQVRSHPTLPFSEAKFQLGFPRQERNHSQQNTQPSAAHRQEYAYQGGPQPVQNTQPPVVHGQQYAYQRGPPPVLHQQHTPPDYPPRNIPRSTAQGQEYTGRGQGGLPHAPHQHETQAISSPYHQQNSQLSPAQRRGPFQRQQPVVPHGTDPALYLSPNASSNPVQPRGPSSQRYEEQQQQTHSANACRRGSAPAFSQQSPQYPTQTQGEGARRGEGIYMNLPLLPPNNAADQNNQQPEEPGYVNVGETPNRVSPYEEVPLLKDKPRTPFSPPNTFNLPEPIVQSRSELERLNALTSEAVNFDPDSIVNARSDQIGYSGPSFDSLMSIQSPEQASLFDQQAEDAWRVGTLPPPSEHSDANSLNKDLTQAKAAEHPTTGNFIRNDLGAAENSHVPSATAQNSNADDNVTQEWLDLNRSPDDDYQNENYQQQHKGLKSYDKPVPESKEKAFSKQLSFQPRESENQRAVNGDEAHQMHSAESLPRNQLDTRGASNTTQPAIGSDMPLPKCLHPGKSKTNPILSGKHAVSYRPHTSPQSSLDSSDYDKSQDRPHLKYKQDTLPEGNCDSDEAYSVIDIKGGTIKESVMCPASEDHPTHTQRSLSHTTCDSLSEPRSRSRADALSKSPSPISRRKRNPPRQKSLDTGLSDHVTSRATGGGGKNDCTKKYLDTLSATPFFPSEDGRDRSHSHTDLDNPEKKHLRSSPSKSEKSSRTLLPIGFGAAVSNTWTCGYCINLVFDGGNNCDVCGHLNPNGSLV